MGVHVYGEIYPDNNYFLLYIVFVLVIVNVKVGIIIVSTMLSVVIDNMHSMVVLADELAWSD